MKQSGLGQQMGFKGETNGDEEWAVEHWAQLMDHTAFPGVVCSPFTDRCCTVITCSKRIGMKKKVDISCSKSSFNCFV